jgi:hypothetical protein
VSILPSNAAQTIAGLGQAERVVSKDIAKKDADKASGRKVIRDEVDLVVVNTESADAIRSLKGNTEEETREDRQEHPGYTAAKPATDEAPPSIDVQA